MTARAHTDLRIECMTWPQFEEAVQRFPGAVVPFGAIEPHGRHAPLGTDPFIAEEIALRVGAETGALVHPYLPLGPMDLLYGFLDIPGALSIDADVVTQVAVNIGLELARNGVKQIVFANGHGPNAAPLTIAAFRIKREAGVQVGVLDWWSAAGETVAEIKGFAYASHADEIETSLVMATGHGGLVRIEDAVHNPRKLEGLPEPERELYLKKIVFTREMDERYVGTSGNMGDPSRASADAGNKIIDATVEVGKKLFVALQQLP